MSITTRTARRSSDLSKHPAEVFAEAEDHPVTVTRRDGDPLILMSQREARAREDLLALASQLIAITTLEGPVEQRMAQVFPWITALTPDDQRQCAHDLIQAARASFSTGTPHLAAAELTSWRETAVAVAEGLGAVDVDWLEQPVAVERP